MSWIFVNLLFTAAYFSFTEWLPEHAPTIDPHLPPFDRLLESAYFSLITASSVGYGDIVPQGISKAFAAAQAVLGILLFGLLVAKLVSRKNDDVINDVHRLTFESIFYHIRQGLFVVRKDFDVLIRDVEHRKMLAPHEWDNLTAAYLQAQSLIEELPDFYSNSSAYILDRKRESLLIDSVQRTLQRLLHLLHCLDREQIDWRAHETSRQQLESLISIIDAAILVWEKQSPNHTIEHFRGILEFQQVLHQEVFGRPKERE